MPKKNLLIATLYGTDDYSGSPLAPTTGAGTAQKMSYLDKTIQVTISGTASLDIEGSIDNTNWSSIQSFSASGSARNQEGWLFLRANITAYTSGDVTVLVSQSEITGGQAPTINVSTADFYTVSGTEPSGASDGDLWFDTGGLDFEVYHSGQFNALAQADEVVANTLFDANSILKADSDNTPLALTITTNSFVGRAAGSISAISVAASQIVGRDASSDLKGLSVAETKTLLDYSISDMSDVASMTEVIGDILYFDGTNWNRLARGADTHVLTMIGSPQLPAWQAAAVVGELDSLTNVAAMTEVTGDILYYDGSNWNRLARGSNGQHLEISGSPLLPSWQTPAAAGISNVVEDTTPQLGGDLDTNSFNILFDDNHGIYSDSGTGTKQYLVFQSVGSSAANWIEITNATSGNGPILSTAGGDANVDLRVTPKGTGALHLSATDLKVDDNRGIVDDSSNELLWFQKTASAVNYVEITNRATGTGPKIAANGSDTDVDLNIETKGAGIIKAADPVQFPSYTVAQLTGSPHVPSSSPAGQQVYCSDMTGGAEFAFSDGSIWRKVSDKTAVS